MQFIQGTYDWRLVALSLSIAITTSYAALDLAERVVANRGGQRHAWLIGGAFAMGSGIWCMHYTGMLAFRLPIPVYYHVPTVALSLLAAIIASGVALYVVSRSEMTTVSIAAGSALMGGGIATMHYTGMAAMRIQAMHHYNEPLLVGSILLAIAIAYVGLLLLFRYREGNHQRAIKGTTALILGLAIAGMHYTGMAAVHFMAVTDPPDLANSIDITNLAVFAIVVVTILILGIALVATLVERELDSQRSQLDQERTILRALIDNIPDYMYVKDRESRFIVANPHLAHELGFSHPEQLQGKTDHDFYPRELADAYLADERRVIDSGEPLYNREEKGRSRTGEEIDVLTTKVPVRDSRGQVVGIAGIGRDISARKAMENALREAEAKYRGIFDKAVFGIFQCTTDGALLNVNPAMAFTFGYESPSEMIEQVTDIAKQLFVDAKRGIEFMLVMDKVGGVRNFECEMFCKDGRKIWLNMSIRAIRERGLVVRYEGMCDDITERNVLKEQLFQAQKLESVGQLAAGIAHEINTPIQYIGDNVRFVKDSVMELFALLAGYGQLLVPGREHAILQSTLALIDARAEKADIAYLTEEVPKALEQAQEGLSRVASLVGAMKEFSHPGTKEKVPIDLNHAIQSTITVARNEWKYVADLESNFDPALPAVACLPGEFNQVILNLIVNAAHAIGDAVQQGRMSKGKITVTTRKCHEWAEILIRDTGTGIPKEIRTRIFDPFFTTKEIGKGTGQGLAIARSVIVNRHHGTIDFESEEGQGTTFIIRLPFGGRPVQGRAA